MRFTHSHTTRGRATPLDNLSTHHWPHFLDLFSSSPPRTRPPPQGPRDPRPRPRLTAMAMAAAMGVASPYHAAHAAASTSCDSLRLLVAEGRPRRPRGVASSSSSSSSAGRRRRPLVFSPRAVSDSKSSQTCLDPDASTVRAPSRPRHRGRWDNLMAAASLHTSLLL